MKKSTFTIGSLCFVLLGLVFILQRDDTRSTTSSKMGGTQYSLEPSTVDQASTKNDQATVIYYDSDSTYSDVDYARFFRPSSKEIKKNSYSYPLYENKSLPVFTKPEEVVYAFFGILQEASNNTNCNIGCGTMGYNQLPYSVAYSLLTPEKQAAQSLDYFKASFYGICHINILSVFPAYRPKGTPENICYYMFEIETIEGEAITPQSIIQGKGMFSYYYGLMTLESTKQSGWLIKDLSYIPENWLCSPYHGWNYDSNYMVETVFKDNQNLITKITDTTTNDGLIQVYAEGNSGSYRFDFVRLTNGRDLLLHQYKQVDGRYVESNFLESKWNYLFFQNGLFSK